MSLKSVLLKSRCDEIGSMEKFTLHEGLVAPLDRANVDTDAIIPKQFLKSIQRTGFGPNLFDEWRYLDRGEPGQDKRLNLGKKDKQASQANPVPMAVDNEGGKPK